MEISTNPIQQYLHHFVELLFPRVCYACGNHLSSSERAICIICEYELPKTNFHLLVDNAVIRRFWGRVDVQNATSYYYFEKGGKVQHLLHQLKYRGKKEAGYYIGLQLGKQLASSPLYQHIDVVVPVPLHKRRLRSRGYNQCDPIAKGIAEGMGITWASNALKRNHYTTTQTKKGRIARWLNVKGLFSINDENTILGKHVLLVDDVITTGATLEACATTLLTSKGTTVSIATLATAR